MGGITVAVLVAAVVALAVFRPWWQAPRVAQPSSDAPLRVEGVLDATDDHVDVVGVVGRDAPTNWGDGCNQWFVVARVSRDGEVEKARFLDHEDLRRRCATAVHSVRHFGRRVVVNAYAAQANRSPVIPSDVAGPAVDTEQVALEFTRDPLHRDANVNVGFGHAVARSRSDYVTRGLGALFDDDRRFIKYGDGDGDDCLNENAVDVWPVDHRLVAFDTDPELTIEVWEPEEQDGVKLYCSGKVTSLDPLDDMASTIRSIRDVVTTDKRVYVIVVADERSAEHDAPVRVIALTRAELERDSRFGDDGALSIPGAQAPDWDYATQQHRGVAVDEHEAGGIVVATTTRATDNVSSNVEVAIHRIDDRGSIDEVYRGPALQARRDPRRGCFVDHLLETNGRYFVTGCGMLVEIRQSSSARRLVDAEVTVTDLCRKAQRETTVCSA